MEAELGEELVALDPQAGNCFGFNEVAAWVWRRLAEPASLDQLRDELLKEYDVTLRIHWTQFLLLPGMRFKLSELARQARSALA